jgi:glyoxylase-like metal-dependent hydrolase (beta-lactamase superfamily II)
MRKILLIRGLAAAAFVGCAAIAYTQSTEPTKIETQKIGDNMYVIHNDYVPGNTTVLVTNEGVILVDDKFPQDGDNILAEVKKITNQPVKYVVNTHFHGDHAGSNPTMQKAGALVVTSEAARKRIIEAKQGGPSNITFHETGHIYLGGEQVDLHYLGRAHTDGDIVALFPKQRVLAAGDMYANDPGTPELVDFDGGGSAIAWPDTLNKALALDFDRAVPGHGTVTPKSGMAKFRDDTLKLRKDVHDMIAAGKTRADIEKYVRSTFGFQDFHVDRSLDGLIKELK